MTHEVTFHFDPACPWCWQTSRWIRHLDRIGHINATWGLFSLAIQNSKEGLTDQDPEAAAKASSHAKSGPALRTAVVVREVGGTPALGRFYEALGTRVHHNKEDLGDTDTVKAALKDADLDPDLLDRALDDPQTWQRVIEEHTELCDRTRSFGVPTIVLDGGDGPAIFGPVIDDPPQDDDEARELFDHVAWLVRYAPFAELKRSRPRPPQL